MKCHDGHFTFIDILCRDRYSLGMSLRTLTHVLACTLAMFLVARPAQSQVLVYRIEIVKSSGINFHTFEGGFFAAPILGGTGSFLLTSTEDGRTYSESDSGGLLFTAIGEGQKKSVISGTTGTGTAKGAFVALGDINHTLSVNSPTASLTVRVARVLSGSAVSADDESTATSTALDGSIGSAGIAQLKFVLDDKQTTLANKQGSSLSQTVTQLKQQLEAEGYTAETTSTTTTTTTGTTTTGTTTSSTGTSTTTGQ